MVSENSSCLLVSVVTIVRTWRKFYGGVCVLQSEEFMCQGRYNLLLHPAVPFPSRTCAEQYLN
jgi:hypothetical protein